MAMVEDNEIENSSESTSMQTEEHEEGRIIIINQPANYVRYRYASEVKNTHGVLRGRHGLPKSEDNFPSIQVIITPEYKNSKFVVVTSLYEPIPDQQQQQQQQPPPVPMLSPHILTKKSKSKSDQDLINEPLTRINDSTFEYKLKDCYIIRTKKEMKQATVEKKLIELEKWKTKNKKLTRSELDAIKRSVHEFYSKEEDPKRNCEQACLGFTIYIEDEKLNRNELFLGPVLSTTIMNIPTFQIKKLCNKYGNMDSETEVTVLVSDAKQNDIEVDIFELGSEKSNQNKRVWETKIDAAKIECFKTAAVIFHTPAYSGKRKRTAEITCFIQLKRVSDQTCSSPEKFIYTPKSVS